MSSRMQQAASAGLYLGVALALELVAGLPTIAEAQVIDPRTVLLPRLDVDSGDTVWISNVDGLSIQGTFVGQGAAAVVVIVGGLSTRFPASQIVQIDAEVEEGIGDGALVGLILGGVGGTIFGAVSAASCRGFCVVSPAHAALVLGGIGAGIGAAAGVLADAIHHPRWTVYRGRGTARLHVAPLVSPERIGAGFSLTWRSVKPNR